MKIGIIGLGKLGLPYATVIAEKGYDVAGYDILPTDTDIITIKNSIKETVINRDIVFVAVPTPHHPDYDGRFQTSHLEPKPFDYHIATDVIKEANMHMNKNQVLVLISTVLPGTIRTLFAPLMTNVKLLYNPCLIALDTIKWDVTNPDMILIGTKKGIRETAVKAKMLSDFYAQLCDNTPRVELGTWEEIETIKIFYNTLISAKLSLINLMQDVAIRVGNIDIDIVTKALENSNIIGSRYMTAGMGDGGPCHPRDTIALKWLAQELDLGYDLFDAVVKAREVQAENMANKLIRYAKMHDLPVVIVGKAYKENVSYCYGSPSILVGSYVEEAGIDLFYHDPLIGSYVEEVGPAVYLLAHNNINLDYAEGSIIIDPWRKYKTDKKNITVIHYGNTRK